AYYRFDDSGENIEDFAHAYPAIDAEDYDLERAANGVDKTDALALNGVDVIGAVGDWLVLAADKEIRGFDDTDFDALPDWWEDLQVVDIDETNDGVDNDGDGQADDTGGPFATPETNVTNNTDDDGDGVVDDAAGSPAGSPEVDLPADIAALDDYDGDGLSNLYEYYVRTNPYKDDTDNDGTLDGDEDTDADGLSDVTEELSGTHPLSTDTDDDGYTDAEEIQHVNAPSPIDSLDSPDIQDRAARFSGTNYLEVVDKVDYGMDSWTVEAWVNLDAAAGDGSVVRRQVAEMSNGDILVNYELGVEDDGGTLRPFVRYILPDGDDADALPDEVKVGGAGTAWSVATGTWVHLAGVYSASSLELALYVDGRAVASLADATTRRVSPAASYGPSRMIVGQGIEGLLDEVRVWDLALTGSQLSANRGVTQPTGLGVLALYYRFDDAGDHAEDFSTTRDWWNDWLNAGIMNDSTGDPVLWEVTSFPPASLDTDEDAEADVAERDVNTDALDSLSTYEPAYLSLDGDGVMTVAGAIPGASGSATRYSLEDWTVETWVYLDTLPSVTGDAAILSEYVITDNGRTNYVLGIGTDDKPYIAFTPHPDSGAAGTTVMAKSANALSTGQWVHVAGTFGDNVLTLYVDGDRAAELTTGHSCALGSGSFTVGEDLDGGLDEMRVWGSARTEAQIEDSIRSFLMFDPPGGTGALIGGTMNQVADPLSTFQRLEQWTLEAWVNVPAAAGSGMIVGRQVPQRTNAGSGIVQRIGTGGNSDLYNYYMGVGPGGLLQGGYTAETYYVRTTGGRTIRRYDYHSTLLNGITPLNDGEWHHVAYTFDGATMTLYVDGRREATGPAMTRGVYDQWIEVWDEYTDRAAHEYDINAGTTRVGNAGYHVDEVRVWDSVLGTSELTSRWLQSLKGDELGLVDYFNFDFHEGVDADPVANYADVRQPADRDPDTGDLRGTGGTIDRAVQAPVLINPILALGDAMVGYFPFDDQGDTAEDFIHRNDVTYAGTFDSAHVSFVDSVDRSTFTWLSPLEDDSDGDNMPDWWEVTYNLWPTVSTGVHGRDGDSDADSLTNLTEYRIDKLDNTAFPNGISRPDQYDSDGDGLADGDEDADQDTISNADEDVLRTWAWTNDTDDDGETDNSELEMGTSPVESLDPFVSRVLQLDGTGDLARVAGDLDRSGSAGYEFDTAFTLEAWIKPANTDGGVIVRKTRSIDGLANYEMGLNSSNQLYLAYQSASGLTQTVTLETMFLPEDEWTYVATTFSGAYTVDTDNDAINDSDWRVAVALYASVPRDGTRFEDFTFTGQASIVPVTGLGDLTFGEGLEGEVDEVRVWNFARAATTLLSNNNRFLPLTDPQVLANPTIPRTDPEEARLIGYWRFDDGGTHSEDFTLHHTADLDPDWPTAARLVADAVMVDGLSGLEDGDQDGLADSWEYKHFDDLSQDGTADSDGDGLTDYYEFLAGLDPNDPDTDDDDTIDSDEDADGDGLSNSEEELYATHPAERDSDDDGVADGFEVRGDPNTTDAVGADPQYITNPRYSMAHFEPQAQGTAYPFATERSFDLSIVTANEGIMVPESSRFDRQGGAWTLEAWIRPATGTATGAIASYQVEGKAAMEIGLDNGVPYVYFQTLGGIVVRAGGADAAIPAFRADVWRHVAGVWEPNANTLTLVLEGKLAFSEMTVLEPLSGDGVLYLGGRGSTAGAGRLTAGLIDELRVWDVTRNVTQLEQARDDLIETGTTGLLAYYRFDDGGMSIEDFAHPQPGADSDDYAINAADVAVVDGRAGLAGTAATAAGLAPAAWTGVMVVDATDANAWDSAVDSVVFDADADGVFKPGTDVVLAGLAPDAGTALAAASAEADWNTTFQYFDAVGGGTVDTAADLIFVDANTDNTYDYLTDSALPIFIDGDADWTVTTNVKSIRGMDDSDDDSLPNWWEDLFVIDVDETTDGADSDGDGVADDLTGPFATPEANTTNNTDDDGDGVVDDTAADAAGRPETDLPVDIQDYADYDSDGLTNLFELYCRTNPYKADTDNDGVEDGDEDFDLDGFNNAAEEAAFTDPRVTDTDDDGDSDSLEIQELTSPIDSLDSSDIQYRAAQFDGTNYLEIEDKLRYGLASWTTEAWVRPDADAVGGTIVRREVGDFNDGSSNYALNYELGIDNEGGTLRPYVRYVLNDGTEVKVGGTGSTLSVVKDGATWSHLAGAYNVATRELVLYVNGIGVASKADADTLNLPPEVGVGPYHLTIGEGIKGLVDEVRIWSRAQTGSRIAANRGVLLYPGLSGLEAYYRFDDAGDHAEDFSRSSDWSNEWVNAAVPGGAAAVTWPTITFPPVSLDTDEDGTPDITERQNNTDELDSLSQFNPAYMDFDGTGSITVKGRIPGSLEQEERLGLATWSVETWVRLDQLPSATGDEAILARYQITENGRDNYVLGIGTDDKPYIAFVPHPDSGGSTAIVAKSAFALTADTWTHLAGTFDGEVLTLYVNAERDAMQISGFECATGVGDLVIGAGLAGDLDETRIWSEVRTEQRLHDAMYSFFMFDPPGGTGAFSGALQQPGGTGELQQLESWTLESWVKLPPTQTADAVLIGRATALPPGTAAGDIHNPLFGSNAWNYCLGVSASGQAVGCYTAHEGATFAFDDVRTIDVTGHTDLRDNEWHHVAYTFNGDTNVMTIYVDGRVEGATQGLNGVWVDNDVARYIGPWNPATGTTHIGRGLVTDPDLVQTALVDESRVWSGVRPLSAINNGMRSSLVGDEDGLVDYYTYDFHEGSVTSSLSNFALARAATTGAAPQMGTPSGGELRRDAQAPVVINATLGLRGRMVAYLPYDDRGTTAEDFMHRNDVTFAGALTGGVTHIDVADPVNFTWEPPLNDDSDGDHMPDWWETQYGLIPSLATGVNGGDADPD
ncbi:MAG: hypothetical protein HON70_11345, partial [Lentisphaerae bacterium]|nr:hypothetical protein [Lentisphaerota bacterium]